MKTSRKWLRGQQQAEEVEPQMIYHIGEEPREQEEGHTKLLPRNVTVVSHSAAFPSENPYTERSYRKTKKKKDNVQNDSPTIGATGLTPFEFGFLLLGFVLAIAGVVLNAVDLYLQIQNNNSTEELFDKQEELKKLIKKVLECVCPLEDSTITNSSNFDLFQL